MTNLFANVRRLDRTHPLDRVPTPELRLAHARLHNAMRVSNAWELNHRIQLREELLGRILRLRGREA